MLIHSRENIRLPNTHCAEIDEFAPELGDMKTHYAGLINATHGYNLNDLNVQSHIVFEIRAREVPIIIQDGQPLARFNLYKMWAEPQGRYEDTKSTSFNNLRSILPSIFKKD